MKTLAIFCSIIALSACSKQQQQAAEQPPPVVDPVAVSDRDTTAPLEEPSDGVNRDAALATNSASDSSTTPSGTTARADSTSPSTSAATTNTTGTSTGSSATTSSTTPSPASAPDNTDKNKRDRKADALTPVDQGNNETDLKITQEIRQALMKDGTLSFNAKNVKIITVSGKVTLRGPVKSAQERASIEAAAKRVAGTTQVDNQLEVK